MTDGTNNQHRQEALQAVADIACLSYLLASASQNKSEPMAHEAVEWAAREIARRTTRIGVGLR